MVNREKRLSETVADELLAMITVEKKFLPGDKLPNENVLSEKLNISRTTLREALRILVTHGVLEIRRGKGTFVTTNESVWPSSVLNPLVEARADAKDLYEIRLIFEPEAARLATVRASDAELKRILQLGNLVEKKIKTGQDRTQEERAFHNAIAKATHNEFMNQLMPVVYQAIDKGVILSKKNEAALQDTILDHRLIMGFLEERNSEGAMNAMKIHILHAIKRLGLE